MNKKNDSYLMKSYPDLYRNRYKPMTETCMCWGFDCGDGWFEIIDDLSSSLTQIMRKYKIKITADQVKEKFGTLRFYYSFSGKCPQETEKLIETLVDVAETASGKTCELCGGIGKLRNTGWMTTLCDKHHKKKIRTGATKQWK